MNKPSYFLIRFKNADSDFEYLDLDGRVDQTTYNEIMPDDILIKYCSETNDKIIERIFLSNHKNHQDIKGSIAAGFYRRRTNHDCMCALLLPIPERLQGLITSKGCWTSDAKYANYVEIEMLLAESFLHNSSFYEEDPAPIKHYKAKDKKKSNLWLELIDADVSVFTDFGMLYSRVMELFETTNNPQGGRP